MRKIIFFLIFAIFPQNVFSENNFNQNLLERADSFFKNQDYYKAEIFYDAFLVEKHSCTALFRSGLCRYYTKRFDEAVVIFKKISENCDQKFKFPSYLILVNSYLELKEPGLAMIELSNLNKISPYSDLSQFALYEKIWLYLRFGKIEKAVKEISGLNKEFREKYFNEDFSENIKLFDKTIKSPVLAGIYSVIPGGGYLYCNRYKDAAFSFFINSLLAGAAYEAFENDMNIAGVLLAGIFTGFYSGNIYGGIRAANVENRIYREEIFKKLEKKFKKAGIPKSLSIDFIVDF